MVVTCCNPPMLLLGYDATILATSVRMDDHEVDQVCNDFKAQAWDLPKAKYPMNGGFHGGFPMAFKLISGKSLLVVRIPGFALDIRWR